MQNISDRFKNTFNIRLNVHRWTEYERKWLLFMTVDWLFLQPCLQSFCVIFDLVYYLFKFETSRFHATWFIKLNCVTIYKHCSSVLIYFILTLQTFEMNHQTKLASHILAFSILKQQRYKWHGVSFYSPNGFSVAIWPIVSFHTTNERSDPWISVTSPAISPFRQLSGAMLWHVFDYEVFALKNFLEQMNWISSSNFNGSQNTCYLNWVKMCAAFRRQSI